MPPVFRSRLGWIVALLLLAAGTGLAARYWLGGYVVRSVLRMAGASDIQHGAVRGTPWQLQVENLRFKVRTQSFAARRVTLQRETWWMASLGNVRVEGAQMPVYLDGSHIDPWNWSTYDQGGLGGEPVSLPFQSLDLEGKVVVRMATVPDMPITVKLEGRPRTGTSWDGSLLAQGEGFHLAGGGSLLRAGQELDFQVTRAELDLAVWSRHIQRLVSLPGGPWIMGGQLTGLAGGKVTAKRFAATARVNLHDGEMRAGSQDIAVRGAEAVLEFSDLWKLRTKSGELRLAELRIGRLAVREVKADFGLWDGRQINVLRATGTTLGGRIETEPFRYTLDQPALEVSLRTEDIRAPNLLALTTGISPRLAGRIGGRVVLRIQDDGVQVTGGTLAVQPGEGAELQLNPSTLLRSGAPMDPETSQLFKGTGARSVLVRLDELRFDLRPEGLPLGTSARVLVSGKVDGSAVSFSYHVNGAVERYLRVMAARR